MKADELCGAAAITLVLALAQLIAGESGAAEVAGPPASGSSAAAPQLQAIGVNIAAPSGYQLRCWQEGRLVIDERGVHVSRELAGDAEPALRDQSSPQVVLLARGSAVCLLKPLLSAAIVQRRAE